MIQFINIIEFYQIIKFSVKKQNSYKRRRLTYMENEWNIFDTIGCVLFIVGIVLKFIWASVYNNEDDLRSPILITSRLI